MHKFEKNKPVNTNIQKTITAYHLCFSKQLKNYMFMEKSMFNSSNYFMSRNK